MRRDSRDGFLYRALQVSLARLLDGIEFKQTAYALDRDSRKVALARFLKRASGVDADEGDEERRLAA